MGARRMLDTIAPLVDTVLAGEVAPTHPSDVVAGLDARSWRERYRPEVVALIGDTLEAAWLIASADGTVDRAERRALVEIARAVARGGLRADDIDDIFDAATASAEAQGLAGRCQSVGERLGRAGAGEAGLRLAVAVAAASQGISPVEVACVVSLANAACVAGPRVDEILRETLAALAVPD